MAAAQRIYCLILSFVFQTFSDLVSIAYLSLCEYVMFIYDSLKDLAGCVTAVSGQELNELQKETF